MTTLPTRHAVDTATPLNFDQTRSERQGNITITVAPAGVTVQIEYTGSLSSIMPTLDRLAESGVCAAVVKPAAQPAKPKAETVEPLYKPDGTACCPVHKRELSEGQYGLYCSAKAKPGEAANKNGYCALRFAE